MAGSGSGRAQGSRAPRRNGDARRRSRRRTRGGGPAARGEPSRKALAAELARALAPPRIALDPAKLEAALAPEEAAKAAQLRYVTPDGPGIARRRAGKGFAYREPDGSPVRAPSTRFRIRKLAIPPAWTDVWICPDPNGHIQATGRDERGRKQYLYHPRWRAVRDETKFGRLVAFAEALPRIRAQVARDLARPGLSRERVLALILRLLETSLIRVGNEEYARSNRSFGLTTLRDEHVEIDGVRLHFEFRAKSGKLQTLDLRDPRLARLVKMCQDLPGQELFQYVDDAGARHAVGSADVNDYLRAASGGEAFTAKDFRTWEASVLAAQLLRSRAQPATLREARRLAKEAIAEVAARLNNTVAICRKSYIHPAILEGYADGSLHARLPGNRPVNGRSPAGLSREEAAVLAFLKRRVRDQARAARGAIAGQQASARARRPAGAPGA
jgi:DNA topoisomerase-1